MSETAGLADDPDTFAADVAAKVDRLDPAAVIALVSGGHDSAAMLLEAVEKGISVDAVAHANTGVGIEYTRQYARELAARVGVAYIEGLPPEGDRFADIVFENGFPGDRYRVHKRVRQRLKGRFKDQLHQSFEGDVVFLTGVRRAESDRRWKALPENGVEPSGRSGRDYTWANPVSQHHGCDVNAVLNRHDCPRNEARDVLGHSGECGCESFGSLQRLREYAHVSPEFAISIVALMDLVARWWVEQDENPWPRQYLVWGHGGLDERLLKELLDGPMQDPADFPPHRCQYCDAEFQDVDVRDAHETQEHDDEQTGLDDFPACSTCPGPVAADGGFTENTEGRDDE